MRCERARQWAALAAGGDLGQRQLKPLRHHLDSCPRCRDLKGELVAMLEELQRLPEPGLDPAAPARVQARVMARVSADRGPRPLRLVTAGAIALAAVSVVALLVVWWSPAGDGPEAPMVGSASPDLAATALAVSAAEPSGSGTDAGDPRGPMVDAPSPVHEHPPAQRIARRRPIEAQEPASSDPAGPRVPIKIVTDDPRVVIYWNVQTSGGST